MNEEPNFKRIFLDTHLTKECKQKMWDGDIDIYNLEELKFCTERAKKVYGGYLSAMREVYGRTIASFQMTLRCGHVWSDKVARTGYTG
ncbi:hypothetical protein Hdeb2414_s0018g00519101 [Helianthus debilis subsp. tardiflorus]